MATYAASISKSGVNTATTIMWNLWSTSASCNLQSLILSMPVASTNLPDFYVVRSTARGTSSTSTTGLGYDPNDSTATGVLDSAWSVAPTANSSASSLLRLPIPLSAGATFYWNADLLTSIIYRGTNGVAIVNAAASGATTGTFVLTASWRE